MKHLPLLFFFWLFCFVWFGLFFFVFFYKLKTIQSLGNVSPVLFHMELTVALKMHKKEAITMKPLHYFGP